jgi:hypothetical protein
MASVFNQNDEKGELPMGKTLTLFGMKRGRLQLKEMGDN